jgi:hypothetical protein
VSDRDGRFISKFWQELFRLSQVKLAMSSLHHPQTDGQTERMNRTMDEMLCHTVTYRQDDWDEALPALEHAYNNSVNATINQEPFVRLYGQKPLDFKDLLLGKKPTPVESVQEFVSRVESFSLMPPTLSQLLTRLQKRMRTSGVLIISLELGIRFCCRQNTLRPLPTKVVSESWQASMPGPMKSSRLCPLSR